MSSKRRVEDDDYMEGEVEPEDPSKLTDADFEDPYEDVEEEEELVEDVEDDSDEEGEPRERNVEEEGDEDDQKPKVVTFIPGVTPLEEGEELEYSSSAYLMLHRLKTEWPALSFDFFPDNLGIERTKFPMTAFCVAGTQAEKANQNRIHVLKLTKLHKTKHDDDEDEDDEDSDEENEDENEDDVDEDAQVDAISVPHNGCINRIRALPQEPGMVAAWSDTGDVSIFNLSTQLQSLQSQSSSSAAAAGGGGDKPLFSFRHSSEGYALDWSPVAAGRLATGDCDNNIRLWNRASGAVWDVSNPFKSHTSSVEDIQWSPAEADVFASCSADGTVRIWDARAPKGCMLSVKVSETDVNVISWNRMVSYLLASGDDDGHHKIWDLRSFQPDASIAAFSWHRGPITSLQWHYTQPNLLAVAGADDQLTIWDLSLERDDEEESQMKMRGEDVPDVPPQLLFVHQGQKEMKELRWHPQLPGVIGVTALDFNIFKTINVD